MVCLGNLGWIKLNLMQSNYSNKLTLLFNRFIQSKVGLNASSNIIAKLWTALLNLLSVPIFLAYLGPEAYGLVGLYASFEVIFNILDLGLSATVNREIARNIASDKPGEDSKNLLRTFEYFYWAIGFAVAALIAYLAGWIANNWVVIQDLSPQQVQVSIFMMAFMFAARWPMTLYTGVFLGLQKQLLVNTITTISATLRVIIAILLLKYFSPEITTFLFWQAISCVLEIFLLLLFAWKELNKISVEKPRIDLQIINQVWKFALSFNLVGVFGMILSQAGVFIASRFVSLREIGYYSVASIAAGSLTLIAYSIGTAIYPIFAAETARNENVSVSNKFHQYVRIIHYFVFGFGAILILFPSEIIYIWTRDWDVVINSAPILFFLAGAALFNSMATGGYLLLIASGNTRIPLLTNFANFIVFIPRYGIIAAAIIWLIENIISYLIYTISVEKLFLNRAYRNYFYKDIAPFLIGIIFWFVGGKILISILDDKFIDLIVISLLTIGYFISMASQIIKDIPLKLNEFA